jgi:HEPN domain-containing protein
MKDESKTWLKYAEENLQSARVLLKSELFNPCLQNAQQSIEKALKALLIEYSVAFRKTHSINELKHAVDAKGIQIELLEDECDFLDSIYLPSKYPLGSALPEFSPDRKICQKSISLAERVFREVQGKLGA